MIFVTVGTHEQQFNRLIEEVDKLKRDGVITEDVIIQTGYSTYKPQYCKWKMLFSYEEMMKNVSEARIVITHGGPSSFIMPLQKGKVPIVVPRQKKFGEHVNDHQVEFCKEVATRKESIIYVEKVSELANIIKNYDVAISKICTKIKGNNSQFCVEFEKLTHEIINN